MLGPRSEKFRELYLQQATNNAQKKFSIHIFRKSVDENFKNLLANVEIPQRVTINEQLLTINNYPVKLRIYRNGEQKNLSPGIIFHPGGGLALDMQVWHDFPCANLCKAAGATIVSIQPPLAPEHKHPTIFEIAYAATKYIFQHAADFAVDANQFVVSGYSMGGNLAALIVNQARKDEDLKITGQVLISAQLDCSLTLRNDPNFNAGAEYDFMAPVSNLKFFIDFSLPEGAVDLKDPDLSPYYANLAGLPPTILVAGGCDALMPDVKAYAEKLRQANVPVKEIIIPGQIHNTTLLYPVLGDGLNPAVAAGRAVKDLF